MSLGVEEIFVVPGVIALGITCVVALGVPGKAEILVLDVVDLVLTGIVSFGFPRVVAIWVTGKIFF